MSEKKRDLKDLRRRFDFGFGEHELNRLVAMGEKDIHFLYKGWFFCPNYVIMWVKTFLFYKPRDPNGPQMFSFCPMCGRRVSRFGMRLDDDTRIIMMMGDDKESKLKDAILVLNKFKKEGA